MNLQDIILDIKQHIGLRIDRNPIVCYIAVGSAAHMVKENNGVKTLEDLYYHQYPKFLEEMNSLYDMTTFHLLIDPTLESPPFMTVDRSKGLEFEQNENVNKYNTVDNKHIVYSLKQPITLPIYDMMEGHNDITEELHQLNQLAINENILLVYHDYSGRNVKLVADYFDPYIMEDLDHIIYGLGARGDNGCYIDILDPSSKFASRLDKTVIYRRDIIKVFNIYHLLYNKLNIHEETSKYDFGMINYISSMVHSIVTNTHEQFNNDIFSKLRTIYQLMIGKTKIEEIQPRYIDNMFNNLGEKELLYSLLKSQKYDVCFNKMIEIYSHELEKIIYLKNLQTDNLSLMKHLVSDPSEYKWYGALKSLLF